LDDLDFVASGWLLVAFVYVLHVLFDPWEILFVLGFLTGWHNLILYLGWQVMGRYQLLTPA